MTKPESQENETLERRRTLYLLGEAVEKLVRLRNILARQRTFVEAHHKRSEYAGVIDPLSSALEDQTVTLTRNSSRIASFLRMKPLDEKEEAALPGILQKVINVVLALHEVLILLPREAAEPQLFYMLRDCFKEEWQDTSVIMTNALTSYEYRIEDVLENLKDIGQHDLTHWKDLLKGFTRSGSVLAQAFVDRDNPLAWAVLAHEYGHALDEAKGISRQIVYGDQAVEKRIAEGDPKVKWASEIFADFVSARVLGPASQIPILLLEMTRPLIKVSDEAPSHPPTTVRLGLTRKFLKELNVSTGDFEEVFELYKFDYTRKLSTLDEAEQLRRREIEGIVETFLQSHVEAVASKVSSMRLCPFGDQQVSHARKLQIKLQSDLPVSSLRETSDSQILTKLDSLVQSKAIPERIYEVLSEFDETPATSSEILTAGWLYKLGSFEDHLKKTFPEAGSPHKPDLDEYGEYLARTDELLLRSIELTAVHSEIIRG
jgi:hypothetical protein